MISKVDKVVIEKFLVFSQGVTVISRESDNGRKKSCPFLSGQLLFIRGGIYKKLKVKIA